MASSPDTSPLSMVAMYRLIKQDAALNALTMDADGKPIISSSMMDLLVASIPALRLGTSPAEYGSDLVVPNVNILDIDEAIATESKTMKEEREKGLKEKRITEEEAERMMDRELSRKNYIEKCYANATNYLRKSNAIPEGTPTPPKVTDQARALVAYAYLAYCKITLKDMDVPPFVVYLFFVGKTSGKKDGSRTDLANYAIANLGELAAIHSSNLDLHALRMKDISAPSFIKNKMTPANSQGEAIVFNMPLFDARGPVQAFKKTKAGKAIVARISELHGLYKGRLVMPTAPKRSRSNGQKHAASSTPKTGDGEEREEKEDGNEEGEAKKKKKDKKEKKDKKKEKKEDEDGKDPDKAKKKEEKAKRKAERAAKRAEKEEKKRSAGDPSANDEKEKEKEKEEKKHAPTQAPPTPPPTPRDAKDTSTQDRAESLMDAFQGAYAREATSTKGEPFEITDKDDLAALGVPALEAADLASMHFWTDTVGTTGNKGIPSLDEMVAILRHATRTTKNIPDDLDSLAWVRAMMTYLGACNRSVYRSAAIEMSTMNRVDLPALGTMSIDQIKQLSSKPEFTETITLNAMLIAILRTSMNAYAEIVSAQ